MRNKTYSGYGVLNTHTLRLAEGLTAQTLVEDYGLALPSRFPATALGANQVPYLVYLVADRPKSLEEMVALYLELTHSYNVYNMDTGAVLLNANTLREVAAAHNIGQSNKSTNAIVAALRSQGLNMYVNTVKKECLLYAYVGEHDELVVRTAKHLSNKLGCSVTNIRNGCVKDAIGLYIRLAALSDFRAAIQHASKANPTLLGTEGHHG